MVKQYQFGFMCMACENEIRFYANDDDRANEIARKAVAEVRRIEAKYSRYREDSVTSHINRCAGGAPVALDAETAALIHHGERCYRISHHRFDLTSGVLRRAWNFKGGALPSAEAVKALLPLVGWDQVQWDGSNLFLPHSGMEVDFGGIGKEYAVDRAALVLATCGIENGLVNLGGDIRVLGPHPDGSPWVVYISHPRSPGTVFTGINLRSGALTTSGDYQRFIEVEGRRYCHVLNPLTGYPVSAWQSVTILSPLCIDAGSISTIAMLLEEDALPFLKSRGESFLMVDASGQVHSSLEQAGA